MYNYLHWIIGNACLAMFILRTEHWNTTILWQNHFTANVSFNVKKCSRYLGVQLITSFLKSIFSQEIKKLHSITFWVHKRQNTFAHKNCKLVLFLEDFKKIVILIQLCHGLEQLLQNTVHVGSNAFFPHTTVYYERKHG